MKSRDQALQLLHEYTKTENLRKHALAVEAAMRAYARKHGEDETKWGIAGLLHDFDYEMYQQVPDHPMKGSEILARHDYPEDVRTAILGHVPALNIPRETLMAKTLFACDELCGFVMACSMVRPNGISDLTASSVKKKMKDKAFARGVSREDILQGTSELGIPFDDHATFVIESLKTISKELGI